MMSNVPVSSKTRSAVLALHLLALCKLGLVFTALTPMISVAKDLTELDLSLPRLLLQALLLGLVGVVVVEAAALGLSRRKNWGWMLAIVVAIMNLTTLLFPFSLAVGWFLFPDSWRHDFSAFIKKEIASSD